MHDKERTNYRSFVHNRQANLQHQLLKARDQINYLKIVKKLESEENKKEYEILLKREQTLVDRLEDLKAEDKNNERYADIVPIFVCNFCKKDCPAQSNQVPRYHCTECDDYDYCDECYKMHSAEHPHPMVRELYAINELQTKVRASKSVTEMLETTFAVYQDRPCLGERKCRVVDANFKGEEDTSDPTLTVMEENNQRVLVQWDPYFSWTSFGDIHQRALRFSYGLRKLVGLNPRSFVGISGENRIDWFIADFACHFASMVVVPIHDRFSVADVAHIIQNCNMTCVVCTEHLLPKYLQAKSEYSSQCTTLTSIIVMKSLWASQQPQHSSDIISIYSFDSVEQHYSNQHTEDPIETVVTAPDDLVTLIYTSGSTGRPKGSMFPDKLWVKLTKEDITDKYDPMVTISKDPLSHISDREDVYDTITSGGRVGFSPVTANLFHDVKILSPSRISATPRFYDVVFTEFKRAYEIEKEKYLHECKTASQNPDPHHMESLRQKVIASFKTVFGHRIKGLAVGGAKSSQVVLDWLKEVFPGLVDEGYGTTEAGSIASNDGSLYQGVQFKLLDVPELGYRSSDKPYARGELLVKTPFTIQGYYNNTDDTQANFDEEGWFHTGDIVELIDSRKVKIIDRKKNIFKLSQGEFVSPAKVESVLVESKFIDQAFVTCGDITKYHQTSVTAIIVPNDKVVIQWALDNQIITHQMLQEKSEAQVMEVLSKNRAVLQQLLLDIQKVGMSAKLRLFEIPAVIHMELDHFTIANGKMTASNKICRPFLEKCYRDKVNELLESMQTNQQDQFSQGISSIMKEVLGLKDNSEAIGSEGNPFLQSGGDSLSAVRLVNLVKDRLHVNLPIELLFNEKASLTTISNFLANTGSKNNNNDHSEAQLEAEILADCKLDTTIQPISTEFDWNSSKDILLTGATGFLGSFLLYELLEQTSSTVYCPTRNAEKRNIKAIFDERGIPWKDSYESRVRLIEGDLAKPNLGLADAMYNELAGSIGIIYHCGAYVNHVQPYEYHKASNVTGTVEVLKFAATTQQKFLNYISTTSVYSQRGKSFHESDPIDTQYFLHMGGYAQSKWVAELLVTEAINRGFPARIFRPGLIGWSTSSGCLSDVDWLYRLIAGMLALKAAPLSRARMNMIPVDHAGKTIVELGQNSSISKKSFVFHIVNPQDTLWTDIVNWISSTDLGNQWNESLKVLAKPLQFRLWWDFVLMELDKSQKQNQRQREQLLMGLMLFSDGIPDEDCHYNLASTVNYLHRQPCPKIDQAITSALVKYITSSNAFEKLKQEQL